MSGDQHTPLPRPIPGSAPSTPAVEPGSFDALLAQHAALVVHFWAPWNSLDISMDRSIRSITSEFVGQVHFRSCNVDPPESHPLCRRCNVVNVPFLAVFVQGQRCRPIVGLREPAVLARELTTRLHEVRGELVGLGPVRIDKTIPDPAG